MADESKRTSPWVFIGIGCLLAVFLVVAVVVAIGAWGFSQVRQMARTMEDPVARTEAASEMLGADALPEGYNAMISFSVPFLVETALLTDRAPDEDGSLERFGEHGFIYFKTLSVGNQEQELRDFFAGDADDAQVLNQTSIRVNTRELIHRGVIEEADRTLRYVSYRGEVGTNNRSDIGEGINSMVMFDCPEAERVRMGIWFGPDPAPETPVEELDVSGTVADPGEIQRFMAHFDVCNR